VDRCGWRRSAALEASRSKTPTNGPELRKQSLKIGVLPAWSWLPPEGAAPRLDLVPWWVQACYEVPFIDATRTHGCGGMGPGRSDRRAVNRSHHHGEPELSRRRRLGHRIGNAHGSSGLRSGLGVGLVITAAMPTPTVTNAMTTTLRTTGHRGRSRQVTWPSDAAMRMAPRSSTAPTSNPAKRRRRAAAELLGGQQHPRGGGAAHEYQGGQGVAVKDNPAAAVAWGEWQQRFHQRPQLVRDQPVRQ
jgi:hypothetical protein